MQCVGADACVQVLRLLLANCEVEEECRNVVAECMGHLALLFPAEVLPALLQRHSDPSPSARAAAITAVKAAVVPGPHPIDDLLRDSIEPFLELMSDPDRHALPILLTLLLLFYYCALLDSTDTQCERDESPDSRLAWFENSSAHVCAGGCARRRCRC